MIKIEFNKFPTHIQLSAKKWFKINNQNLYNQSLHHFSRAKVIKDMKEQFTEVLPQISITDLPVAIFIQYYAPINYGDIRRYKGNISWKKIAPVKLNEYEPSSDLDNMVFCWSKAIQDAIVHFGIIPDDTIKYVNSLFYKYIQIEEFEERKMVVNIVSKSELNNILLKCNNLANTELEILEILLK